MQLKRALHQALLIIGFIALFMAIRFQSSIKEFISFNIDKFKIHAGNSFYQVSTKPRRLVPIMTMDRENELRAAFGSPFNEFSDEDWKKFWEVLYGAFPKDPPERPGLPQRVRQLDPQEIMQELESVYHDAFTDFDDDDWQKALGIGLQK